MFTSPFENCRFWIDGLRDGWKKGSKFCFTVLSRDSAFPHSLFYCQFYLHLHSLFAFFPCLNSSIAHCFPHLLLIWWADWLRYKTDLSPFGRLIQSFLLILTIIFSTSIWATITKLSLRSPIGVIRNEAYIKRRPTVNNVVIKVKTFKVNAITRSFDLFQPLAFNPHIHKCSTSHHFQLRECSGNHQSLSQPYFTAIYRHVVELLVINAYVLREPNPLGKILICWTKITVALIDA